MQPIRVLLIDDDAQDRRLVKHALSEGSGKNRFTTEEADSLQAAEEHLKNNSFDIALLDLNLPGSHGTETVQNFRRINAEIPVVILTGLEDEDMAIEAIKAGADDYVAKGNLSNDLLPRSIRYSIERKKTEMNLRQAKQEAERLQAETELANKHLQVSIERANLMTKEAMLSNQAKGEFLANMSHEIRTPMNGILGFTDILMDENINQQQREYVSIIKNAANNLLTLVNDILDFSKVEAGKLDTQIKPFNLKTFLDDIVQLIKLEADKKNIEFRLELNPNVNEIISSDSARLRQCLFNLLSNAIKFTNEGHIALRIYIESKDNNNFVHFDVEDSGIGIPPDKQDFVFEAFSQIDGSPTREHGGTGLGLAITKQLAELLGGRLTLTSEIGKGSVFSLCIPAFPSEDMKLTEENKNGEISEELAAAARIGQSQKQALVVEDNRTNQLLITLLLQKLGLKVAAVNNGIEALEKITNETETFDLIFMDMQMPQMNGYETTKKLRSMDIQTPIIAITAHAMQGDREKCIECGCNDYLSKPVSRVKLQEIVAHYLPINPIIAENHMEAFKQ